jgi:hypothetical protein
VIWGGLLVGRQVSTAQRAELEYLGSRGIELTPTRFKDSNNNQIHKLVLLSYKVGAMLRSCGTERDPGVRSRGLPRTFAHDDKEIGDGCGYKILCALDAQTTFCFAAGLNRAAGSGRVPLAGFFCEAALPHQ